MTDLKDFQKQEERCLFPTYNRYPLAICKGQGYFLYDATGKKYYDFLSGIAVCILGHNHPQISKTICEQAQKLLHVSNLFFQEEQLELAQKLLRFAPQNKVFFCNSGAEANEGAIKLVRRYFREAKKENRFEIITFSNSFHGRTLATLTATGQDKIKQGFEPLVPGFKILPFNNSDVLRQSIGQETAAIMLEVIQGEGGIVPVNSDFVQTIKHLCAKHDLLLIVDEIQTGMGRTGEFFAHTHYGLDPDIITLAKGLGNGLPIGAVMAKEKLAQAMAPGSHGSTFGGNPLACKVASKVLEILEQDRLLERAQTRGAYLKKELLGLQENFPELIAEVRGQGLMLGVELKQDPKRVWTKLLEQGFITNLTQDKVLRLLPPLILDEDAVQKFTHTLKNILSKL
ncbi:MAG: aspartate aminotransferase family protein [Desulfonauticus sp.]|nr:aspartate aminotransferase family protein [Desulfonauticus sp.]